MKMLIFIAFLLSCLTCLSQQNKAITYKRDTIIINHQKLIRINKEAKFESMLTFAGDTIVKLHNYYATIEFPDINEDGYKDIRVHIVSNTPNECDNYLFDKRTKKFILVENCNLDIRLVKGSPYYYSYNRAGCADRNWESDLSKIENYKLIPIGYMHGQGCDFDLKENQKIEIYKVGNSKGEDKVLVKRLPLKKHIPRLEDMPMFIENYWRHNWRFFLK
ncbi:hypothetical protein [Pinibacter aurantiacus]|uniref:VCBS repeat-containing protein n=1 Tax=Pinibacter aurantiacus TaxID=2851599 RepID=A0A9E2SE05_9BACT|nr:hypothetical protein [Pinibacter aurantiacus]MBV4359722.1 hypothetical protein [Pinibacter aurantiacus]